MAGPTSTLPTALPSTAAWAERFAESTAAWGRRTLIDPDALVTERAILRGFDAPGRVSCGGACRLLRAADGWVAVSLARTTDIDLVPAWLALLGAAGASGATESTSEHDAPDPWTPITAATRRSTTADLARTATLLGLAVGALGERTDDGRFGVGETQVGTLPRRRPNARPNAPRNARPIQVVDLSALWAGPLCAALLGRAGAAVTKVESTTRPDGARRGDPALFARLDAGKAHRVVDVTTERGRAELAELVATADVVVESSRPRALRQLGIDADELLRRPDGPQVWVSITGHGRSSGRVGFGDDAAVAGGLVASGGADHADRADGPRFLGDAIADPLTGIVAATVASEAVAAGRRVLLDVALAGVAAGFAAEYAAAAEST